MFTYQINGQLNMYAKRSTGGHIDTTYSSSPLELVIRKKHNKPT